jgi:hypothetical protein
MGIMSEAAEDALDILNQEGEDCIFTVTDGVTVVSVTCKALPAAYGFKFDNGFEAPSIGKTARLTVSVLALEALNYPVRNNAGKVALKGHQITYTDVSGEQATYKVAEQFPNALTGLIVLQLSESAMAAPPGRTIIGWKSCAIYLKIVETPDGSTQTLINGDTIPAQYPLNDDGTLTIPYIAEYNVLTPFMYAQFPIDNLPYDIATGTFDNSAENGFSLNANCGFNAVIPIFAS